MKNKLLERMRSGQLTTDQSFLISNVFPDQINKAFEQVEKESKKTKITEAERKRGWNKVKAQCTK